MASGLLKDHLFGNPQNNRVVTKGNSRMAWINGNNGNTRKRPDMKAKTIRKLGFTLVEIMIVVAIIGLISAIAIPSWVRARSTSQQNACINNLRQIDGAKQQWALEFKVLPGVTPNVTDIQPYMGRGTVGGTPTCPQDSSQTFATSYNVGPVSTAPTCIPNSATHFLQ
jgi:prepilin-type N-terminal cleavage/methylation domain-containing protein